VQVNRCYHRDPIHLVELKLVEALRQRYVDQGAAARAVEMGVGVQDPVEPGGASIAGTDLANQPLVLEEVQVPVDRPQADVGNNSSRVLVDLFGSGVFFRLVEDIQDDSPLPGVACFFHGPLLYLDMNANIDCDLFFVKVIEWGQKNRYKKDYHFLD
jgi:hypothetical protein